GQPDERRPEPGGGELASAVDPSVDGHLGPVAGQLRPAGRPPAPAVSATHVEETGRPGLPGRPFSLVALARTRGARRRADPARRLGASSRPLMAACAAGTIQ